MKTNLDHFKYLSWESSMWCYWLSWTDFKRQSLNKSTQPSSLARAGDWTSLPESKPGNQIGLNKAHLLGLEDQPACSLQLEHDKGLCQGLNPPDCKRFLSGNPLACFPGLRTHRHVCQVAGPRGATMDSPSTATEQEVLPQCSPVLWQRGWWLTWSGGKLHKRILSKQVTVLKVSGKPAFLLLEKGATNMEREKNKFYNAGLKFKVSSISRRIDWRGRTGEGFLF